MLCVWQGQAQAHRLDQYLQATLFSVEQTRLTGSMRLVPGVAVAPGIIVRIDADRNGVISAAEERRYAEQVLRDLTLRVDGQDLRPELVAVHVPPIAQMKEGTGEITVEFAAGLPPGGGHRTITFENHHERQVSAYLVNSLLPQDRSIQIAGQRRNHNQSSYSLEYSEAAFPNMFRLGMRHIAEGTDHLLFLLTLLLPAPLLLAGTSWAGPAGVRQSIRQILSVVTAFTVGHSITLALAAFGVVRVPSQPIEVLIAASILVSALHALRPVFSGREGWIAAGFGLLHGLAFASALQQLGIGWRERAVSVLGFNLGIEAMQLLLVCAVMPPLIVLSRTRAYVPLRVGGAVLALGMAAIWMSERMADRADLVLAFR